MFGQRILILIPHPDDEVVGCAAAIGKARAQGAEVFGLHLSHGCIPPEELWPFQRAGHASRVARRMHEAERTAAMLGIGMVGTNERRAAREIWRDLGAVRAEVLKAIDVAKPDCIWAPAYEGGNPDHDALNALASTLAGVPVFEFTEYHFAGGRPQINRFIAARGGEVTLTLSPEECDGKLAALAVYRSERGNLRLLRPGQEQFRPLARYDYAARPHPGTLWYERFQWVPFHHPGVDRTRAEQVSHAIQEFLAREGARS